MATFQSNTSNGFYLKMIVTPGTADIAANRTPVTWELRLYSGDRSFDQYRTTDDTAASINGSQVWSSNSAQMGIGMNTSKKLGGGSLNVTHNADGTKSIAINAKFETNTKDSYTPSTALVISTSMTLPRINRGRAYFKAGTSLKKGQVFFYDSSGKPRQAIGVWFYDSNGKPRRSQV